jgi:hypothetical protein
MLNRFQTGANKEARTNRSSSWPSKADVPRLQTPEERHIGGYATPGDLTGS